MIDSQQEIIPNHGSDEQGIILREYSEIVEHLKHDLCVCKEEQGNIRSEIGALQKENRAAVEIVRNAISCIHAEECGTKEFCDKEAVANLQERITVLQMEKDAISQLWNLSLKAIDALEEELKVAQSDGKNIKLYEEKLNGVKETYSEAIRALEARLQQAKENFLKHQSLWETSNEKIETLSKEKAEIMRRYTSLQRETEERDKDNWQQMEKMRKELAAAKVEIQQMTYLKSEMEKKLNETKKFAANIVERDKETKSKMSEALELIESAIGEKELALQREALLLEEKMKLERRLATVTDEYAARLEEETKKLKSIHEEDIQKYLLEMKESKMELRQKITLLDRTQRECRLAEEELDRVRRNSEELIRKSNERIVELEHQLKQTEFQAKFCDETFKKPYDSEIKQLQDKIVALEEKLQMLNDKPKTIREEDATETEYKIKEADIRTKTAMERCGSLETQLNKILEDKETLALEVKSLKYVLESQKTDYQRRLEDKVRELEENLRRANQLNEQLSRNFTVPFYSEDANIQQKRKLDTVAENKNHCCQMAIAEQLSKLQEKFEKKTKELTHHVETHQKLSKRWREEAKSLAGKFQKKSKDFRMKINALKKENNELNAELLTCKQQLVQYRIQAAHGYYADENR